MNEFVYILTCTEWKIKREIVQYSVERICIISMTDCGAVYPQSSEKTMDITAQLCYNTKITWVIVPIAFV